MSASVFMVCVVAGLALLALPPMLYAHRKNWPMAALLALPVVPAVALEVALFTLNGSAQVGWGFVLYPFFCVMVCIASLYLFVFLLPSIAASRLWSGVLLASVSLIAFVWGAVASPWYE